MTFVPVVLVASKEELDVSKVNAQVYITGIGPANAAKSAAVFLSNFDYGGIFSRRVPLLINVGTAGASVDRKDVFNTGDIVLPTSVGKFNFDGHTFEFQVLSDNTKIISNLSILKELSKNEKLFKQIDGRRLYDTSILSSPFFVNEKNFTPLQYSKMSSNFRFFDMESAYLEEVIKPTKYPFHVMKIVSDFANIPSNGWEERANMLRESLTEATNALISDLCEYYNRY